MKPHLTSSSMATTEHLDDQDRTAEVLAHPMSIGDRAGRTQTVHARPHLALASTLVWRHDLILTGRLDYRTVIELDDEIDCLCEEGVTALTLDLRRLEGIDSIGAKTIVRHGVACKRQGLDFAVIPGSPVVHRALAEAGAKSLLADDPDETGVLHLATRTSDSSPDNTSTIMTKSL